MQDIAACAIEHAQKFNVPVVFPFDLECSSGSDDDQHQPENIMQDSMSVNFMQSVGSVVFSPGGLFSQIGVTYNWGADDQKKSWNDIGKIWKDIHAQLQQFNAQHREKIEHQSQVSQEISLGMISMLNKVYDLGYRENALWARFYNGDMQSAVTLVTSDKIQTTFIFDNNDLCGNRVYELPAELAQLRGYTIPDKELIAVKPETIEQKQHRQAVQKTKEKADTQYGKKAREFDEKLAYARKFPPTSSQGQGSRKSASYEALLPVETYYKFERTADGKVVTDNQGKYFDDHKRTWQYDEKEARWVVTYLNGSLSYMKPLQADVVARPQAHECGSWKDVDNKPKNLVTPMPEPKKDEKQGCGKKPDDVQKAPILHTPAPVIEKPQTRGCGKKEEKTLEELQNELVMYSGPGKKKEQSKLAGAGLKPRTPEQIKETTKFNSQHPHGKYFDAEYHTEEGNSIKSPKPRNGQEALDNSYAVNGSNQRVAVVDGKIVILKYTGRDEVYGCSVYHGYVVKDFHSIKDANIKDTLIENDCVKNPKKGSLK